MVRKFLSSMVLVAMLLSVIGPVLPAAAKTAEQVQPPQQDWIAYIKDNNLWLVHPDGSGAKQITFDAAISMNSGLQWSPDGTKLAFSKPVPHQENFYLKSIEVYDVSRGQFVHSIQDTSGGFAWLPDSRWLVYDKPVVYTNDTRECPTVLSQYDGLYMLDTLNGAPSTYLVANTGQPLLVPSIAPDGKHLILRHDLYQTMYGAGPYMVTTSTAGAIQQLAGSWDRCGWSPDGSQIACDTWGTQCDLGMGGSCPITLYSPEGTVLSTISMSEGLYDLHPQWSPDNQFIAINATDGFSFADGPCMGGSGPSIYANKIYIDLVSVPGYSRRRLTEGIFLDWSPDGKQLLVSRQNQIYVVDRETSASGPAIGEGWQARWQPRAVEQYRASLDTWFARKDQAIEDITTPEYEWLLGLKTNANLPLLNERPARQLLEQLRRDTQSVTAEQAEGFYRLVIQEETIASTQNNFEAITDDEAEAWSDFLNMGIYTLEMLAGHDRAAVWFKKFFEDAASIYIYSVVEPDQREEKENFVNAVLTIFLTGATPADYAIELAPEMVLRLMVARDNHEQFIEKVQPSLQKGVNSVNTEEDPFWNVTGNQASAENTTGYLRRTSDLFYKTGHENYLQTRNALKLAAIMSEVADGVTILSKEVSWQLWVIEVYLKIQFAMLNIWQVYEHIEPVKECSTAMAEAAGRQSFDPAPQDVPDCSFPEFPLGGLYNQRFPSSTYVDGAAWDDFKNRYTEVLEQYGDQINTLSQTLESDETLTAEDTRPLDATLSSLDRVLSEGTVLLQPPVGEAWDEQSLTMAKKLLEVEGQTAILLYALDAPAETAQQGEETAAVLQSLESMRSVIEENQDALEHLDFAGEAAGIGLVEIENDPISAAPGEEAAVEIRLMNIGSGNLEAGMLSISSPFMQNPLNLATPGLKSGESIITTVSIPAGRQLPELALIRYAAGSRVITKHAQIVERAHDEAVLPAATSRDQPFGYIAGGLSLALGVGLLTLGVIFSRRRRK